MYLVTGSSGHLGEALMRLGQARRLPMRGADIASGAFTTDIGDLSDAVFAAKVVDGCKGVLHTATLHKPHIATHSRQAFVNTNITATLNLLEAAKPTRIPFVFTSTTSAFGAALTPPPGEPAAWITESVRAVPKNIYGVTKTSAEDLCELFARKFDMPVVILRTSRFFPEPDDDPAKRAAMPTSAAQLCELAFRRLDVADAAAAHLLAVAKASELGFGKFILSAPTPFLPEDCAGLRSDAPKVLESRLPGTSAALAAMGWSFYPSIDRVYDSSAAQTTLGWTATHDFATVLNRVQNGDAVLSDLAQMVGTKGYHGDQYVDGIYPT